MPLRGHFKMSDNENILTCAVNYSILNERHVNKNVNKVNRCFTSFTVVIL
jgi:hypothetical protein